MFEKIQTKLPLDRHSLFTDKFKKTNNLILQCENSAAAGNSIKINGLIETGNIVVPIARSTPIEILAKKFPQGVALI